MSNYPYYVHCLSCKEDRRADETKFVDIEEDSTGRDLMTFDCPCGAKLQRGLVFTK